MEMNWVTQTVLGKKEKIHIEELTSHILASKSNSQQLKLHQNHDDASDPMS